MVNQLELNQPHRKREAIRKLRKLPRGIPLNGILLETYAEEGKIPNLSTLRNYFGRIEDICKIAGLPKKTQCNVSKKDSIKQLQKLPKKGFMDFNKLISYGKENKIPNYSTLRKHFGNFRNICKVGGLKYQPTLTEMRKAYKKRFL